MPARSAGHGPTADGRNGTQSAKEEFECLICYVRPVRSCVLSGRNALVLVHGADMRLSLMPEPREDTTINGRRPGPQR
jgi:hypothetical protein